MTKFDAYFSDIFEILGKLPRKGGGVWRGGGRGGLTPKGKITKPAHFVF